MGDVAEFNGASAEGTVCDMCEKRVEGRVAEILVQHEYTIGICQSCLSDLLDEVRS